MSSKKIIHYCWFGGKPLPKLAKKCIRSWEKYLPDYEIMRWDESNFDINITQFSKQAYEARKWAFVSDVARVYALKEYGGIYFDTDMLVTKNIDLLLKNEFFAGWESPEYVAVGVLACKNPNNEVIVDLVQKYEKLSFEGSDIYSVSIPILLTTLLKNKYGLKSIHWKNQKLKGGIYIYSRDYFYPLSYDYQDKMFTKNTCMIHYYDGSWISKPQQFLNKLYRIFGRGCMDFVVKVLSFTKKSLKKLLEILLYPFVRRRRAKRHLQYLKKREVEIVNELKHIPKGECIVIYNPNWLGTTYATKELFQYTIAIEEVYLWDYIERIAVMICDRKPKLVVFSAFAEGWENLARKIKEIDKKIEEHSAFPLFQRQKTIFYSKIIRLHKDGVVSSLGFVKKSMADFYNAKGYRAEFVMNNFTLKNKYKKPKSTNFTKIGLYASGDRWVKNFYNQLSAASLVKDSLVECIPISEKIYEIANMLKLNVVGNREPIEREILFGKMAENDINLYVTFVECAPMLPLESLELGVPCITGNNHHYWEGHELRKYLVVDQADNSMAIYEKIKYCLDNKEKIMELYKEWKREYDKKAKENLDNFTKVPDGIHRKIRNK